MKYTFGGVVERAMYTDEQMEKKFRDWRIISVMSSSNASKACFNLVEEEGINGYNAYYCSTNGRHYEKFFHPGKDLGVFKDIRKIPNILDYIDSVVLTDGKQIKEFYKDWTRVKYILEEDFEE